MGEEEYHFDGSVDVTVEMPEAMKTAKNPCIVHLKDDGTCEAVAFTVNNDETVTITVNGFSSFVVLDVETTIAEETADKPQQETTDGADTEENENAVSVQTEESNLTVLWVVLPVVLAASCALIAIRKKKKAETK